MTLSHIELEQPLELTPQTVNVLVVENRRQMNKFCSELCLQAEGGDGQFAFFDGARQLSLVKDVKVVPDVLRIAFNDKKAQNGLQNTLCAISENRLLAEFTSLQQQIFDFLDKLNGESDFPIDYNVDGGVAALIKAFGVHWQEDYDDVVERLSSYLKCFSSILKIRCFVFFNLKTFLDDEQLVNLYHEAMLDEICLLLVESTVRDKLPDEKITVIDKDLAEFVV